MELQRKLQNEPMLVISNTVLEAFPAGVLVCDERGIITHCNNELLNLFIYSRNDLIGQSIDILLTDAIRTQHKKHVDNFFTQPTKKNMGNGRLLYGRRSDGFSVPVEIGLNPIETERGTQVIATVADISNRQDLEKNFELIVETAPVGMLIVDADGKIYHGNEQILSIFGYEIPEIKDQPLEMLLPERHREEHVKSRDGYIKKPEVRAMGMSRDLMGRHKNGTEFPVEIGLNPINMKSGKFIVATVTDITQRKKSELKLQQLNADLDEFTYVASHDLKSPLRGIGLLLEWIEDDLGDNVSDDVHSNIKRIHVRIERMEKLVDDLLSYARSGRQVSTSKMINIQEMIDNVIELVAPPQGFTINLDGYLGKIESYQAPLETVLRNLISNAVKHHDRSEGVVDINVSISGAYCIFEVVSDGPGIPEVAHERIFKLFQTLSNDDGTRSGVGLAVCKRMVESHGGKIVLISQENQRGSCFRFSWPRFSRSDINEQCL